MIFQLHALSGVDLRVPYFRFAGFQGEMKALAMFYSSPVGQKAITKTPELMSKTAGIGAKISQPHSSELSAQLSARRDELKAQAAAKNPGAGGTPPPASAAPPPSLPTPK